MDDIQITDEDINQAKSFAEENNFASSDLKITCEEYKNKYSDNIESVLEGLEVLEIVGFPGIATKLLKIAKKRLDKKCGVAAG